MRKRLKYISFLTGENCKRYDGEKKYFSTEQFQEKMIMNMLPSTINHLEQMLLLNKMIFLLQR